MPRKPTTPDLPPPDYATVRVTHHALTRERAETLRRGRSKQPECLVVGHAWTEDPTLHGSTICMTCQVVRWP